MQTLPIFHRAYGDPQSSRTPVLLLHGLFGSSANWHGIAKHLAQERPVVSMDLRNHGRSPWDASMGYKEMAADLGALLDSIGVERAVLVGHSMGGKAAMWLALTQPDRVEAVVVADIAPVTYPGRFETIVDALSRLELDGLGSRREAETRLEDRLPDPAVRAYLLQNLIKEGDGWRWRVNLASLSRSIDQLMSFPRADGRQYPGPALFVYGTDSDYVTGTQLGAIRMLFPLARLRAVSNAGHWVYADQPDAFVRAVKGFLRD